MEIKKYQSQINIILDEFINKISNQKIKDMTEWSLKGGKRLRSMIVIDVSNNVKKNNNLKINVNEIAISCELLHTVSLIIDDLPCMDNDNYRREIETIHFKYGVNNAIYMSMFLISQVKYLLNSNIKKLENEMNDENVNTIREILVENYLENYNIAILGQYVDICPIKKAKEDNIIFTGNIKAKYLRNIIIDKTAPFFEIAFVGGYLISGGDIKNYEKLKKISQLFGIIFQISDDFEDQQQDLEKNCQSLIQNYVLVIGKEQAIKDFYYFTNIFITEMKEINLYSELFKNIVNYLLNRVKKFI